MTDAPADSPPPPPAPERILIIRPSALGDVCRTVPVLASLRAACPDARIEWIVQDDFVAAVAAHPALDEVIAFPRRRGGRWWRDPKIAREMWRWFGDLRRRNYDLVLDCQGLGRSGLMTWVTGAPTRIGHRGARELAWLAANHRVPGAERRHTVDEMLALVEAAGLPVVRDMRLYVDEADAAWWRGERPDPRPYAVLAPTSRWLSKRWPIESWRELVAPLRERGFARCVVIGAPGEREQVAPLTADDPPAEVVDLVGRTTIGQTMAVIAAADLVIANDSAALHMAVGFDRPCLGLYGPTDPALVGPYTDVDCVLRAPRDADEADVHYRDANLGDRLMRRIAPADVLARLDGLGHAAPAPAAAATTTTGDGDAS